MPLCIAYGYTARQNHRRFWCGKSFNINKERERQEIGSESGGEEERKEEERTREREGGWGRGKEGKRREDREMEHNKFSPILVDL